jgi:hypothetical protein
MEGAWEERAERDNTRLPVSLDAGVDAAERLLDENRPMAAALTLEGQSFGELAYQPGAEPLAGRHLRQNLTTCLHRQYVEALIAAGRLDILPPRGAPPSATSTRLASSPARPVATQPGLRPDAPSV